MKLFITFIAIAVCASFCGSQSPPFVWPSGKKAAISLTFDDARASQVNGGTELLNRYGAKATFYVVPSAVKGQIKGWKSAVASGHEIGNHSLNHPCSGNFPWSREKAIENYSLDQMRAELQEANKLIEDLLGIKAVVFAYPCGQTFIGRGVNTKSYVPLVSDLFLTGRGWKDEGANDPAFCDFAQLTGIETDGKDFQDILPILTTAIQNNQWVVFAGHEMGEQGDQTTRLSMLSKLIEYAQDPAHELWLAPVGTVAKYVQENRK